MMEFQDFPMILGKSGKHEIHPPKLCAGLPGAARAGSGAVVATRPPSARHFEHRWKSDRNTLTTATHQITA